LWEFSENSSHTDLCRAPQAEYLLVTSPVALGFLTKWQLGSKEDSPEWKRTRQKMDLLL
jgi:hypothetical protein